MKISHIKLTPLHANCFMIVTDSAAICIDPGAYDERVLDFLNKNADKERLILLTHCHFDHVGGAERLRSETGVKIAIGELDAPALLDGQINLSVYFRSGLSPFCADVKLGDCEEIKVGDLKIKTYHTPGHTEGGVCFLINGCLFTGDTFFCGTIGRTDFPGGDEKTLRASLKRILEELPDDTAVYPGHMEFTTIEREKVFNPYYEAM